MGARYYDPKGGRFLSPDPIAYPLCLDLYAYANGDPINYIDPNGRFASQAYHSTKHTVVSTVHDIIPKPRSHYYEVGSIELPNGQINLTNGINNHEKDAKKSASLISKYGNGVKVYGLYNATHTAPVDAAECLMGQLGIPTRACFLQKRQWKEFARTHGPDAKLLQFGHSGGTIVIRNALRLCSKALRDKIIVVAISPAAVVPKSLCYRSFNYACRGDLVPLTDILGNILHQDEIIWLEPHKDAHFPYHSFNSPTFEEPIQNHITDYIEQYGGLK